MCLVSLFQFWCSNAKRSPSDESDLPLGGICTSNKLPFECIARQWPWQVNIDYNLMTLQYLQPSWGFHIQKDINQVPDQLSCFCFWYCFEEWPDKLDKTSKLCHNNIIKHNQSQQWDSINFYKYMYLYPLWVLPVNPPADGSLFLHLYSSTFTGPCATEYYSCKWSFKFTQAPEPLNKPKRI